MTPLSISAKQQLFTGVQSGLTDLVKWSQQVFQLFVHVVGWMIVGNLRRIESKWDYVLSTNKIEMHARCWHCITVLRSKVSCINEREENVPACAKQHVVY